MGSGASTNLRTSNSGEKSARSRNGSIRMVDNNSNSKSPVIPELFVELRNAMLNGDDFEMRTAMNHILVLSSSRDNQAALASVSLGLMPLIMSNIAFYPDCVTIIANIATSPQTHAYLLSPEVDVMSYVVTSLKTFDSRKGREYVDAVRILSIISETLASDNIELFLAYDLLMTVVKRFLKVPLKDLIDGRDVWIVTFLKAVSFFRLAVPNLKELKVLPRLTELMQETSIVGVKASIAVFNIVGASKELDLSQILWLERLLVVFKAILTPSDEEVRRCKKVVLDYCVGAIKLRSICGALRTLSIRDDNKAVLMKTGVLSLLIHALKLCCCSSLLSVSQKVCGVGEDQESAEVIIETVLQLSLCFGSDTALKEAFIWASEHCITDILSVCCADSSKLSKIAQSSARHLLLHLSNEDDSFFSKKASRSFHDTNTRVYLHYSLEDRNILWIQGIAYKLSKYHQVEQSSEETCDVSVTIAAIDNADTVVVCISPQYWESGLCRLAAEHIQRRRVNNPSLKVLFVTTSGDYRSAASLPAEGWLSSLVAESDMQPLLNASMISPAANHLHEMMQYDEDEDGVLTTPAYSLASRSATPKGCTPL